VHFPGERFGPVYGEDVSEVPGDRPPHSGKKVKVIMKMNLLCITLTTYDDMY
jgi:hypothetical protein